MKPINRRMIWLGTAAVVVPFGSMASYLAATRGSNFHSATTLDLFFMCIGLGIGCICLWGLPFRPITKIAMVLPYIAIIGASSFLFGLWFLATFYGIGP